MAKAFNIWCNAKLSAAALTLLKQNMGGHHLIVVKSDSDPSLQLADVAFGQPNPLQMVASERIKWVHLSGAGYTRYDTSALRAAIQPRGILVTNSSSVYCRPCAEHLLAMMMALSRQLPQAFREQLGSRPWQTAAIRAGCNVLEGQTALIFGFGAIATRLVELLAPLHMNLIGVRREARGNEPIRIVTPADAESVLPDADHVIDILPETTETQSFFNARRFGRMKRGAMFYNVGRGATVDQIALQAALESNHLAAAYLDVVTPEPLPATHPLWQVSNCFITPHVGGVHAAQYQRLAAHFLDNLRRFEAGEPLMGRVLCNSCAG